ncbi:hypothetical protein BB560_005403 [Smittium megazygosporum]|uniref:Uncharacterized protein n=1 Tax=Smittium megazygosporum TaxID=133381 RepID=A0A2T9Z680_9FUNG|nr:hypothetical protein BB560_005403 [Smittium megazygosporum]
MLRKINLYLPKPNTQRIQNYLNFGSNEKKADSIQYNVFSSTTPAIDELLFGLFCAGYSISDIQAQYASQIQNNTDYVPQFKSYVENQYLMFSFIEEYLYKPDYFLDQTNIFSISTTSKLRLIKLYYTFDNAVLFELLYHYLNSRFRNKISEISSKTGIQSKSVLRQYENCRRILKFTENEEPERLEKRIAEKFKIPSLLAKQYFTIVFISSNKINVTKKTLYGYTFPDFNYCIQVIVECFTLLPPSMDSSASTRHPSNSQLVRATRIYNEKMLDLASKILSVLIEDKVLFEKFLGHVVSSLTKDSVWLSDSEVKKENTMLENLKARFTKHNKPSASLDSKNKINNLSSDDKLNASPDNQKLHSSYRSNANSAQNISSLNSNFCMPSRKSENSQNSRPSNNAQKDSFVPQNSTQQHKNSTTNTDNTSLNTSQRDVSKPITNIKPSLHAVTFRTLMRNLLLSITSLGMDKSRQDFFVHIVDKVVYMLDHIGLDCNHFITLINHCTLVISTNYLTLLSPEDQIPETNSLLVTMFGGIKLIVVRLCESRNKNVV